MVCVFCKNSPKAFPLIPLKHPIIEIFCATTPVKKMAVCPYCKEVWCFE